MIINLDQDTEQQLDIWRQNYKAQHGKAITRDRAVRRLLSQQLKNTVPVPGLLDRVKDLEARVATIEFRHNIEQGAACNPKRY